MWKIVKRCFLYLSPTEFAVCVQVHVYAELKFLKKACLRYYHKHMICYMLHIICRLLQAIKSRFPILNCTRILNFLNISIDSLAEIGSYWEDGHRRVLLNPLMSVLSYRQCPDNITTTSINTWATLDSLPVTKKSVAISLV